MKHEFRPEGILRSEAMKILIEHLGIVDAERFINCIMNDHFDYTVWQRDLWKDKTVEEINQEAAAYFAKKYPNGYS